MPSMASSKNGLAISTNNKSEVQLRELEQKRLCCSFPQEQNKLGWARSVCSSFPSLIPPQAAGCPINPLVPGLLCHSHPRECSRAVSAPRPLVRERNKTNDHSAAWASIRISSQSPFWSKLKFLLHFPVLYHICNLLLNQATLQTFFCRKSFNRGKKIGTGSIP